MCSGAMQTYWLEIKKQSSPSHSSGSDGDSANLNLSLGGLAVLSGDVRDAAEQARLSSKMKRLVTWNADILVRLLKAIVAVSCFRFSFCVETSWRRVH